MGAVVLCTSESGNAQLGSNHNEIEMKNNIWAVWGPLWLGGLGPLDKTALVMPLGSLCVFHHSF